MLGALFCAALPEQHDLTGITGGWACDCGFDLLLQQPPVCATGGVAALGLQQLESSSFCAGRIRGVELALERGDASLLALLSVRVVCDDVSVSLSWLALMAFSNEVGCIAVDFRFDFETRLLPATATDCARSDGQAHSEVFGMV